jgi:hypothetical protein
VTYRGSGSDWQTFSQPSTPPAPICNEVACPTAWYFDGVRIRLLEIGEAVKALSDGLSTGKSLSDKRNICEQEVHDLTRVRFGKILKLLL